MDLGKLTFKSQETLARVVQIAKQNKNSSWVRRATFKRLIQEEILDPLALRIVEGKIGEGNTVKLRIIKDKIKIE